MSLTLIPVTQKSTISSNRATSEQAARSAECSYKTDIICTQTVSDILHTTAPDSQPGIVVQVEGAGLQTPEHHKGAGKCTLSGLDPSMDFNHDPKH